uniref:RCC1-like domain-containing protein n=1 Tax=Haplochromis burtoni TaxID=8153 RepID=A0A3Q2UUT5_HAPBU
VYLDFSSVSCSFSFSPLEAFSNKQRHADSPTDGQLYTWGQDCRGQLGLGTRKSVCRSPQHVPSLSAIPVIQVAAGGDQSFALSVSGGVFSWGRNDCGQLGLGDTKGTSVCRSPQHVPSLSAIPVIQVAAGGDQSFALSVSGGVFSWGRNDCGQLGLGDTKGTQYVNSPQHVRSLSAIPVVQVAAGGEQSFALSVSGGVFSWGRNDCGQLGLGDTQDRHTPTPVHYLNMKKTVSISCGKDHTAALTKDGAVFTFGSGQYGQLGHNSLQNEQRPRLVEVRTPFMSTIMTSLYLLNLTFEDTHLSFSSCQQR